MNLVSELINHQGFLVLDGALATELERHGADLDDPLWSARCLLDAPQLIRRVHLDYLQAGADVITSASYQASRHGFRQRGLSPEQCDEVLRQSVGIAVQARDDFWADESNRRGRLRPLVAASIGPFGACLHDGSEYHGRYAAGWNEVEAFHRERLQVICEGRADLLAFETIPSQPEAEILLALLAEFPEQRAWLSFSCRDAGKVSHGESFRECLELVHGHSQIVAAGLNCTMPRFVTDLLKSVGDPPCPMLAYPNSGETWVAESNYWTGQGGDVFTAAEWYEAGARLIGGCCRTGPADIVRIRRELDSRLGRFRGNVGAK